MVAFDQVGTDTAAKGLLNTLHEMGVGSHFAHELVALAELHVAKRADYGRDDDSNANLNASSRFGVPPWVGAMVRLNDKVERIASFVRKGELRNEPVDDSLRDIAAYALLAKILRTADSSEFTFRFKDCSP